MEKPRYADYMEDRTDVELNNPPQPGHPVNFREMYTKIAQLERDVADLQHEFYNLKAKEK